MMMKRRPRDSIAPCFFRVAALGGKRSDRDIGAFFGVHDRDASSNPGVAARDDGDLIFKLARGLVVRRSVMGPWPQLGFDARLLQLPWREGWFRLEVLRLLRGMFRFHDRTKRAMV
jgi:hypothetical protein